MNLSVLEENVESAIRNGSRAQARSMLKELKGQSVPRVRAKTFANLARRCGLLPLALEVLQPIVRPAVSRSEKPTPEESAAYALILIGLDAVSEGIKLLKEADQGNPEVILAQAFAATKSWDYETASTKLLQFEKCKGPTDYQRMTASVNLAASQIALGHFDHASKRLDAILSETQGQKWHLLHKNALELTTQLAILRSDWKTFDAISKHGKQIREAEFDLDDFFLAKWNAIAALHRSKGSPASLSMLDKVRTQALAHHHHETVRDCDYQRSTVTQDRELALHVFFGTPYASFKHRILSATSGWLEVPSFYIWNVATGRKSNSKDPRMFDLEDGSEIGTELGFATKRGGSLHTALKVLCSDFYRPFPMGNLLSAMYPDEYINPYSSPKRAAYLVHRLRKWFEANHLPLEILNDGRGYQLKANKPFGIKILSHQEMTVTANLDASKKAMFETLRNQIKQVRFSIHDVAKRLDISERSARYFINWAAELNLVERVGTGRITQYRIRQ